MHHCLNWPSSRNLIPVWNSAPSLPKLADPSPRHVGGTRRKTSMENICQKTPLQNTCQRARGLGAPGKEIIFKLSCFSIDRHNAQRLPCTALPFDGCRNCCSCFHCQICWASATCCGPGQFWYVLHTGQGPPHIVWHAGSLLYFRFPTCRSAKSDDNRCANVYFGVASNGYPFVPLICHFFMLAENPHWLITHDTSTKTWTVGQLHWDLQ